MCEYLASPSLNSEKVQRLITVRSCGGRRPGPRRTATQPRSRRPRCELPPPPSRRHRSPVGFSASCGGAAPSPVRVRVAAGAPGIGGPDCGRPSAPGREPPCWDLSADPPPSRLRVPGAGEDVWGEKKKMTLLTCSEHHPMISLPPPFHLKAIPIGPYLQIINIIPHFSFCQFSL